MDILTYERKLEKYTNGDYMFNVPPVTTAAWATEDWIKFIDSNGKWNFNHDDRADYYTRKVVETRAYIAWCVSERALYEADKDNYINTYRDRVTDESDRDRIKLGLQVIEQGIKSTLFDYVENISIDDECELAELLGCDENEPFQPFIDEYLNGRENRL